MTHLKTVILFTATFLGVAATSASALGAANVPLPRGEAGSFGSSINLAQSGMGRRWQILREFHQSAAPNREKADITVIRCQGSDYYIYRYYRPSGPNYRAIIPGRWGNPLGGKDQWTFDAAAGAACNWSGSNRGNAGNSISAKTYFNRGVAQFKLGNMQSAIADFSKAIAINPNYSMAYYNRGLTKAKLGNMQSAIADFSKAIATNPNYWQAYYNRAKAKSRLGNKQGAIADYSKAIAINSKHASSYHNRALVKYRLGNKLGSCSDFKKAASLGHKNSSQYLQSDAGTWCRTMR